MSSHVVTAHQTANESGKRRWVAICCCGWVGPVAKNEKTALRVAETNHIERKQQHPCPTPDKKRFKSQEVATAAMRLFWRTAGKGKAMPTRVYQCPCGGWHTTSKPLRRHLEAS